LPSLTLLLTCVDSALAKKKPPSHPININSASSAELQMVGIGPATAQKILQTRKSYGSFKDVNDLLAIGGIGQKRLDKMRKYLVVSNPPVAKTSSHPSLGAGTSAAKAHGSTGQECRGGSRAKQGSCSCGAGRRGTIESQHPVVDQSSGSAISEA
jgi:competence protein ComEA